MNLLETRRRDLVTAPLLAMAAMALRPKPVRAAGVDPTMTIVKRPEEIPWKPLYNFPLGMAESATMYGGIDAPGQYFVLIRWHPGYMSAPHWYETDRLYVVISGIWYVALIINLRGITDFAGLRFFWTAALGLGPFACLALSALLADCHVHGKSADTRLVCAALTVGLSPWVWWPLSLWFGVR